MSISAQQLELITKAHDGVLMAGTDLADLSKGADPLLTLAVTEARQDIEALAQRLIDLKNAMHAEAL